MRTGSIQLARVFGIRIGASPSWFVVALIFIVWLSTAYDDQYGQTMKISATTTAGLRRCGSRRGCELDRPCAHSHTWWQARSSERAARQLSGYASYPTACLGCATWLSVKLGLSFGAILALTVARIAVDVHNVKGLESAHNGVTKGVVPRVIATQRAEAAFADLHFAQTSMVLTGGKTRATRWTTSLSPTRPSLRCARPTATPARTSAWPWSPTPSRRGTSSTPSSTPPSSAATPATPSRPWPATRTPRPTT